MTECPGCLIDRAAKIREIRRLAKLAARWADDPRGDRYRVELAAAKARLDMSHECPHETRIGTARGGRIGDRAAVTPYRGGRA